MRLLHSIHSFDVRAFDWCMARRHRQLLTGVGRLISKTADGPLYVLLVLFLWWYGFNGVAMALVVAFAAERTLYFVMKNSFKRNRPQQALPGFTSFITPSDQFSFPSGHTSAAFLVAAYLALLAPQFWLAFYLWSCLVGVSRIFLGVHFPTDVLMGSILGSSTALITLVLMV